MEALPRRAPDRAARRRDGDGRRLADDAAPRPLLRLQAVDRDRDGHRPRRDLQVVRCRPAPSARSRPRAADGVDAARLGAVLDPRRRARLVAQARVRRRLRGHGEGDPRRRARRLRRRLPGQGVPPLDPRGQALHPRAARPCDRRRDRRRRRVRRRPDVCRQRHPLRARDARRVPAHRREDRRHRHLPRGDPAHGRGCGPPARRARRPGCDGLAADRLRARRPDRRAFHRRVARPRASDRARGDAHARRRQARRPARRRRDRARGRGRSRHRGACRRRPLARGTQRRPGHPAGRGSAPARAAAGGTRRTGGP